MYADQLFGVIANGAFSAGEYKADHTRVALFQMAGEGEGGPSGSVATS